MEKMIQIKESTFRELNRQMYTLYRYFSVVSSDLLSEDKRVHTSSQTLEGEERPWTSFHFQDEICEICICRGRNKHFHLDCRGIILTEIPPYLARGRVYSDARYQHYFGDYETLDSAVESWRTVIKQYTNQTLGVFF